MLTAFVMMRMRMRMTLDSLIKRRWEYRPHWREASYFLLPEHRQVQLFKVGFKLFHYY